MPAKYMCLDLRSCALLCWSCAHARALQQQTQLVWQPYRDSKVLNAAYAVLFWKEGPGTAEIKQDQKKIELLTEQYFDHTFDMFLQKAFAHGPTGLSHYVSNLVAIRKYDLEAVQQMLREAGSINEAVIGEAKEAVRTLAKIKLGSAVVLAGLACYPVLAGAGASLIFQAGVVKLGYDLSGEAVKEKEHFTDNLKGISFQLKKYVGEFAADSGKEYVEEIGKHGLKTYEKKLMLAQQRVERYSVELARRIRSKKALKIGRRLENAEADAATAGQALKVAKSTKKVAKVAGKAIPLVFAAWDIYDAINEYKEDTEEAE